VRRVGWLGSGPPPTHRITRFLFLRALGAIYAVAFLVAARQIVPLCGEHGILPARWHLEEVARGHESALGAFWAEPTLFWAATPDWLLVALAWIGVALAVAVVLGLADAPLLALLWALYLSFTGVGQVFYGYGWEILLLEAGFLAIFIAPGLDPRPFPRAPVPPVLIWVGRWLVFRLMFGAGLIKMRGDPCWQDLSCLVSHYETQPSPSPLSLWFHHLPVWVHQIGVAFNHLVELVAPWFLFLPRPLRHPAAILIVVFQLVLIASGNLSFLNWLTLACAILCFDDALLGRVVPRRLRERLERAETLETPPRARRIVAFTYAAIVGLLSLNPIVNMLSPAQAMNTSFEPFHLVNSYGAFGSVGRERFEVVLEGTLDDPGDPGARWRAYELPCKPGDPERRPCFLTPYHLRLDWQMWFAALGDYESEPWIVRLAFLLLRGERSVMPLFDDDPFPDRPPRAVRARLYRYRFVSPGERGWWRRELARPRDDYLRPITLDDPGMRGFLRAHRWLPEQHRQH
jgi:hypothetical protein